MGVTSAFGGGGVVLWLQGLCGAGLNKDDSGKVSGIRSSGIHLFVHGSRIHFRLAFPFLWLHCVVEKDAKNSFRVFVKCRSVFTRDV